MFGKQQVPACGFSIGLERILVVMEQRGMFPDDLSAADVLLGSTQNGHEDRLLSMAYLLREHGLKVDSHNSKIKPAKFRQKAEQQQCAYAVWIDHDEGLAVWNRTQDAIEKLSKVSLHLL